MKIKAKRPRLRFALPLAAALLLPGTAFAATNLPQSDANLPEKQQENALESRLPNHAGGSKAMMPFRLSRIDVEQDGTQLLEKAIEERTAAYLRRNISELDVNDLLAELTQYARSHGYPAAAAYLPAQSNADGTLTIRILAGRYGKITVENSAAISDAKIERLAHALKEGAPIEGKPLETALYNIAALGGIEAAGLLSPGTTFGTGDLTIRVKDGKRQSYVLYSENYGSEPSGRYRFGLQGSFENLTKSGDRLNLGLTLSNKDLHNYSISYSHPVGADGTTLGIGVSRMDYELSGAFRRLGAEGTADTLSIFGTTPLWRTAQSSLAVTYGWDWRRLKDEYKKIGMELEKHSSTFHLGIKGAERQYRTSWSYDLTGYCGHLGADSDWARRQMKRAGTEGSFTKGVLNLNLRHEISDRWNISLKAQAQKAGTNLDSSEEIYLGGANGVRAYPQGEASGDNGYLGSIELSCRTDVPTSSSAPASTWAACSTPTTEKTAAKPSKAGASASPTAAPATTSCASTGRAASASPRTQATTPRQRIACGSWSARSGKRKAKECSREKIAALFLLQRKGYGTGLQSNLPAVQFEGVESRGR